MKGVCIYAYAVGPRLAMHHLAAIYYFLTSVIKVSGGRVTRG